MCIRDSAGAAGMFCGSCLNDNTLARGLSKQGWDIQLVPTYTPIRTDSDDFSVDQVFFGGINVFLQQKVPLLRYVPAVLDRFLDNPWLIRKVTARAIDTDARVLGKLAVSMLKGKKGNQRKEVKRLCDWLEKTAQPDVVVFSNILIGGCIGEIKRRLNVPVLVVLQGDDVFLDGLLPEFKQQAFDEISKITAQVDGFVVHSQFFRDYMAGYFGIPLEKIHVTPLGIDVSDFQTFADSAARTPVENRAIGYLARLAPEKGLHVLVDAFIKLKQQPEHENTTLKIGGWLGGPNQEYADNQFQRLADAGLEDQYEYLGAFDRTGKIDLLSSVDVLSVPTVFKEPKGLYALEAMAAGVPIVQPNHGCFPELVQAAGCGQLFEPENADDLAEKLNQVLQQPTRFEDARRGQRFVFETRNATAMSSAMSDVLKSM